MVKLRRPNTSIKPKMRSSLAILNTFFLESNKQIKINFNGGDLSSDGDLLLIKEFASRVGLVKLVKKLFETNDSASFRIHTDPDSLMQMIYQIIATYFEDDCADELTTDPVFIAALEKEALASHPTLSRFRNRMDANNIAKEEPVAEESNDRHVKIETRKRTPSVLTHSRKRS